MRKSKIISCILASALLAETLSVNVSATEIVLVNDSVSINQCSDEPAKNADELMLEEDGIFEEINNSVFCEYKTISSDSCIKAEDCSDVDSDPDEAEYFEEVSTPDTLVRDVKIRKIFGYTDFAAVSEDGSLWMWGSNSVGQLGNGTHTDSYTPIRVNGINDVVEVSPTMHGTAAVTRDGSLWEWGDGDGYGFGSLVPTKVAGISDVVSASYLGPYWRAALTKDGSVWEWGRLGRYVSSKIPVKKDGISGVKSLYMDYSSAAITADGSLWMWSNRELNDHGQLGNGTTTASNVPTKVEGLSDVVSVSLSSSTSAAVTKDGSLWMWGENKNGQLGNGTTADSYVPVKVDAVRDVTVFKVVSSAAELAHSAAITKDGSLWMWGSNNYGELGNGTNTASCVPIKVEGINDVSDICLSGACVLALTKDGSVWEWGNHVDGTNSKVPKKVEGLKDVVSICLNWGSNAALTKDGSLWTWGNNGSGRLGDGTDINRNRPVMIFGESPKTEDKTIVLGQKLNLKETCFANVFETIDRYVVDDTKLASVSKDMISGKKSGTVRVTAQKKISENEYDSIAECQVTILSKPKIKFTKTMTYAGQTVNAMNFFLTEDTKSLGATYWESAKPGVVKVIDAGAGILKVNGPGSANITAYFGEKGATGTLKVSAVLAVKIPEFQKSEYTMQTGGKLTLSMKNVTGAMNPSWMADKEGIIRVTAQTDKKGNKTGKVILEGLACGDTELIATIDGQPYKCTVHVAKPVINKTTMELKVGKTGSLSIKNTKIKKQDIVWTSEDPSIATVDSAGKVKAVSTGSTVIYTEAGGYRNECIVTVK